MYRLTYRNRDLASTPVKPKKATLKPLNRPRSEDRIRELNEARSKGNRGFRHQGLYTQKLTPLNHNASTSAVRECKNYIEEENRFIIKTKKQIKVFIVLFLFYNIDSIEFVFDPESNEH